VVHNLYERLPDETVRREFVLPPFVEKMVERKMVGEKAGQGFYKRVRTPDGESQILTLDPATLEYRQRQSPRLGSLEADRAD
jgi:3-hydroxyacyl-CoA dehydrogenase